MRFRLLVTPLMVLTIAAFWMRVVVDVPADQPNGHETPAATPGKLAYWESYPARLPIWPFPRSSAVEAAAVTSPTGSREEYDFSRSIRREGWTVLTKAQKNPILDRIEPATIEVSCGNRRVWGETGRPYSTMTLRSHGRGGPRDPLPPDLHGDGVPDVVLDQTALGNWTGGRLRILELTDSPRTLLDLKWADRVAFIDADGDGCQEVVYGEDSGALRPWKFPPYPQLVLRWNGTAYQIATDLMKAPPPSEEDLKAWATELRGYGREENAPASFYEGGPYGHIMIGLDSAVQELYYTGNLATAERFVHEAWPHHWNRCGEYWEYCIARLVKSRYHKELQRMNGQSP